jgi:hypothetical protein
LRIGFLFLLSLVAFYLNLFACLPFSASGVKWKFRIHLLIAKKMFTNVLITVALAGAACAFTPPGFEPASSNNLTVAFGNVLAVNGVDIPKAGTCLVSTHKFRHR